MSPFLVFSPSPSHLDIYSYIEEFWYESYLSHSDPVVLALNPYFILEYIFPDPHFHHLIPFG